MLRDAPHLGLLLVALGLALWRCSEEESPSPPPEDARSTAAQGLALGRMGKDRRIALAALQGGFHRYARALGAHKLTCRSTVRTTLPDRPEQKVEQQLTLRIDGKGRFAATKETDPQYGQEVIWAGDLLYLRLRYSKFVRRRPAAGEPASLADRMASYLPAYVGLLGRFIDVQEVGKRVEQGREALEVKLKLNPNPPPGPRRSNPASSWRETMAVKKLQGIALLDVKTGAPLVARLDASWSFNPPATDRLPASGIPEGMDRETVGMMRLSFEQRITELGKAQSIAPPPEDQITSVRRRRLELERQMLMGERPLPSHTGRKR